MRRKITEFVRRIVLAQAQNRCEYCRAWISSSQLFELDHITPVTSDGGNEPENLALACHRCNLNKRENVKYSDPVSGRIVLLFNPRRQSWDEHFRNPTINIGGDPIGTSPEGRATAALLFRKTAHSGLNDLRWSIAGVELPDKAPFGLLLQFRAHQQRNEFQPVFGFFSRLNNYICGLRSRGAWNLSNAEEELFAFALTILRIEALISRSREGSESNDIATALAFIDVQRKRFSDSENASSLLLKWKSVAFHQMGTLLFYNGDLRNATRFNRMAADVLATLLRHSLSRHDAVDVGYRIDFLNGCFYENRQILRTGIKRISDANYLASSQELTSFVDFLIGGGFLRQLEQTLPILSKAHVVFKDMCGNHFGFNPISRRYFAARLLLGDRVGEDLLKEILCGFQYSSRISCSNEVRSFACFLQKNGQAKAVKEFVSGYSMELERFGVKNIPNAKPCLGQVKTARTDFH